MLQVLSMVALLFFLVPLKVTTPFRQVKKGFKIQSLGVKCLSFLEKQELFRSIW